MSNKDNLLEDIENIQNWSKEHKFKCNKCHIAVTTQSCKTEKFGEVCLSCAANIIYQHNDKKYNKQTLLETLSPEGNILDKVFVLKSIRHIYFYDLLKDNSTLMMLIQNLGFLSDHPLARYIRRGAVDSLLFLSQFRNENIVEMLLEVLKNIVKQPWQYHANVIVTLYELRCNNTLLKKHIFDILNEIDSPISIFFKSYFPEKIIKENLDIQKTINAIQTQESYELNENFFEIYNKSKVSYNKQYLLQVYNKYFHPIFHFFSDDKMLTKTELLIIFAIVLSNKVFIQKLIKSLPDQVQKILDRLLWVVEVEGVTKIEQEYKVKILKSSNYNSPEIDVNYFLFYVYYYNGILTITIHDEIKRIIKSNLSIPEWAKLKPLTQVKSSFSYFDNDEILDKIDVIFKYVKQDNVKYSTNGKTILKSTLKQMEKFFQIKEFYKDTKNNKLRHLKINFIVDFISNSPIKPEHSQVDFFKKTFDMFFSNPSKLNFSFLKLLPHLKMKNNYYTTDIISNSNNKKVVKSLLTLLKKMGDMNWYSVENLLHNAICNNLFFLIIDKNSASNYIYYDQLLNYGYKEKQYVKPPLYTNVVIMPLLKSLLFFLSTFGIVEIAYDLPYNSNITIQNQDYLSPYDGLKFVRITKFGDYIIGLTTKYDYHYLEEEAHIVLDENRLIISIEGSIKDKIYVLENIGKQISSHCYIVNFQTFLKDCTKKRDIERKIKIFQSEISIDPPPIWKTFFKKVLTKINPLNPATDFMVFQLENDEELIHHFTHDPLLKKYSLKSENFFVLIKKSHYSKVKKQLEALGYLLENK